MCSILIPFVFWRPRMIMYYQIYEESWLIRSIVRCGFSHPSYEEIPSKRSIMPWFSSSCARKLYHHVSMGVLIWSECCYYFDYVSTGFIGQYDDGNGGYHFNFSQKRCWMISSFWKLLGIRQAKMNGEKLGSVAREFLNNIMVSFCEILLFSNSWSWICTLPILNCSEFVS